MAALGWAGDSGSRILVRRSCVTAARNPAGFWNSTYISYDHGLGLEQGVTVAHSCGSHDDSCLKSPYL